MSYLEASRTPVNELNGALGLDRGDGLIYVFWHDVTSVEQTAGHVLSLTRIALDHLVLGLEAGVRDLGHAYLLMVRLLGRDD